MVMKRHEEKEIERGLIRILKNSIYGYYSPYEPIMINNEQTQKAEKSVMDWSVEAKEESK